MTRFYKKKSINFCYPKLIWVNHDFAIKQLPWVLVPHLLFWLALTSMIQHSLQAFSSHVNRGPFQSALQHHLVNFWNPTQWVNQISYLIKVTCIYYFFLFELDNKFKLATYCHHQVIIKLLKIIKIYSKKGANRTKCTLVLT